MITCDLVALVTSFFMKGVIPHNLNSNLMVLLSKVEGAHKVKQFRPIMLGNFLFKIITKIIATRLVNFVGAS